MSGPTVTDQSRCGAQTEGVLGLVLVCEQVAGHVGPHVQGRTYFDSVSAARDDDNDRLITVYWRDCDCEWWTKSCEELHTKRSTLPLSVLRHALDGQP